MPTTPRPDRYYRIPIWAWPLWEAHGRVILDEGLSQLQCSRRYGLTERKGRTLHNIVHRHGPRPHRAWPHTNRMHMIIPDAHAAHGQDFRRFEWAAKLALAYRPDVIICIGDWADCHSVSRFDEGTATGEGRRLMADVSAANEALRVFHRVLDDHNEASPENTYVPRLVITLGNHEHRITSYANRHPALVGIVSLDAFDFTKRGWEVIPFAEPIEIDGVTYVHYMQTKAGRAKSGIYLGAALTREWRRSVTVGHSHEWDYRVWRDRETEQHGLVCGCYLEHWEEYAQQGNDRWWSGLLLKRLNAPGEYDLERWSLRRIKRVFGG